MGIIPKSTQSKQAESVSNLLEENHALLRGIELLSNIGHWEVELTTGKQRWSEQLFRILGLDPKTVQPSMEIGLAAIHPEDRDKTSTAFQNSLESGAPYKIEMRVIRPSGELGMWSLMAQRTSQLRVLHSGCLAFSET